MRDTGPHREYGERPEPKVQPPREEKGERPEPKVQPPPKK